VRAFRFFRFALSLSSLSQWLTSSWPWKDEKEDQQDANLVPISETA
jgi:hypothetical protein